MTDEVLSVAQLPDDVEFERSLRPRRLAEFIGQERVKEQLALVLQGARNRNSPADHLLFSGPPGLGKPVANDSLVLMSDGSRRRIGDVVVGDLVISGRGRPCLVSGVYEQGQLAVLRLTTHTGREVLTAPDHPFLTPEGWAKAADLEVGDVLANVPWPEIEDSSTQTEEEFRLAGYVVGDGCTRGTNCNITNGDPEVLADIRSVLDACGFAHYDYVNSPNSTRVIFRGARPWLRAHGLSNVKSEHKRVPPFVFRGSVRKVAEFLAAYFACDGFVSRRGRTRYDVVCEFYSTNRLLLADVQHLLLRLGVQSRLTLKRGRYEGHLHESWRLTITSQDGLARFCHLPLIGARGDRLRQQWRPRRDRFDERLLPDPIVAVEATGFADCRCITIEDDHTYTVNDLVCHNTSLAGIVATEMGADLRTTSGPALERPGDLAAILSNLEAGDVLFVDEIHRLPRAVEEILYPAMEDFTLDIVVGKGPGAKALRLPLPAFTLVGATTRTGLVTGPLRDRFGFAARLEFYSAEELAGIVHRSARILDVLTDDEGAREVAGRSRGTPRIANRLLKRVRDYAEVRADGVVTGPVARAALELFEVDARGLDKLDRWVLLALCRDFGGGPVGLSTLAVAVGEEPDTVEDVVEPFLIQQGLLARTPRGRVATGGAFAHLGIAPPGPGPESLFGSG